MSASTWVAAGLALVTAAAWVRLAAWAMRARADAQVRGWRLATLLAAQPVLAILLHLTLFPPAGFAGHGETLLVATRGAARLAALGAGLRVDLPEAPAGLGGEPAPDLATALRRHPGATRLRVLGEGLEPRDRPSAAGLAVTFAPPAPPPGLAELHPPERVAPGGAFPVGGRVEGAAGGSVELLDPAGRVVDAQPLTAAGEFRLTATARDPGMALFAVRVRDPGRAVREVADVPVWIAADPGPSVLLLAGAPGPEVKQLRRWALDAGVPLQASVSAGDGLELGEARPRLDAAALDRLDLVIVDERSWAALGAGERAALVAATRAGMGLLLRVTGSVPAAVREQWAGLGLPLGSGDETAVVRLAPDASPSAAQGAAPQPGDALPDLTRRLVDVPAEGAAPLALDRASAVLGRWRPVGRGRAGTWSVTDSSGLVTAGFGDRYGELWSGLVARLARASLAPASLRNDASADLPRPGRRVSICGVGVGAEVMDPQGGVVRLIVDPAAGPARCAAYWPTTSGWRVLRAASGTAAPQDRPFYVYPADAAPGVRALDLRDGTLQLAGRDPPPAQADVLSHPTGPAWPWLLLLLAASAGAWRFERASRQRS